MPAAATSAWWGSGAPPTERWPGVTIEIDDYGGKYRFDEEKAGRVTSFFPRFCSHSKGDSAGQPFALLDYQSALILRPLFGWVHAESGLRRFRKAYVEIPKKNGKTQLVAGLALYMLLADGEAGAEVYVAAADREQARILFNAAKAMVEANPSLSKRLICYQNQITRRDDPTAFFKVLSAEAATKHGPNIHCLIIDELHAQPDRDLFETLTRGVIARSQPIILLITTAGDDDESICFEEYEYAKKVLSGTNIDEQHLPVIFEAHPNEDWTDPRVWTQVNPGLGHTIKPASLEVFAREAQNEPRKRNDFLRYHLNRWTGQATAWLPVEWWDACEAEEIAIDAYQRWSDGVASELTSLPCAAGLDLAQKIDLACFAVTFRRRLEKAASQEQQVEVIADDHGTGPVKKLVSLNYMVTILPFFWIPEDTMKEREKADGVPYTIWKEAGLVTATEGVTIDYDRIYDDIKTKILPRFPKLKQGGVGYDPAFGTDIATTLRDKAGMKIKEVLQNYTHMSEPCYIFEALVRAKRVRHGGHRILRNHIENTAVKMDDARRLRPVKPKKGSKHVDGTVSSLMGVRMLAEVPDKRSGGVMFV